MSAFSPSPVRIVRATKTKTASLAYVDGPEQDVPGSPFTARYYRQATRSVRGRDEGAQGISDANSQQVLSIADASAPVKVGDVALLPPGTADAGETRAKILRVRRYASGLQCDIETGAE